MHDVDGDGKPDWCTASEGQMRYAKPDLLNPTAPWKVHNVSERGYVTAHGVGAGDINGDGRADIVNPYGWWEHPPAGSNKEPWVYHPQAFGHYKRGFGGSVMAVSRNGDKRMMWPVLAPNGWGWLGLAEAQRPGESLRAAT